MTSRKEKLKEQNRAFKESLENQLEALKSNFSKTGKNALWISGGLVAAYGVIKLLNNKPIKKKKGKKKKGTSTQKNLAVHQEPILSSAMKEQLILFLLGLAVEKLTRFLKELDEDGR